MKAPYFVTAGQHGEAITLYLEDCVEGMDKRLQMGGVDVVVTSPPYNIGAAYNSYHDRLPRQDYLDWMEKVGKGIWRVLNDNGSFFLNVGGTLVDPWIPFDIAQRLRE